MNRKAWIAFWILGLIWGSSFLLIRVGVEDIPATELVLIRIFIAAVGLNIARMLRGIPLPRDWPTIRAFSLIGLGNAAIPYTLISLGEQTITSGMAAVLQSTVSLFTLVIAHFAFADEHMTTQRVVGLTIGFIGIVVLYSNSIVDGKIDMPVFMGQMAMILASLFYATFIVYSRMVIRRNIQPIVIAAGTFLPALFWAALFVLLEPVLGGRAFIPPSDLPRESLWAAIGLGFFNTFIAYIFFYYIIRELGSFRASMVTYVVPVVGLMLGVLVLDERVTITMIIGAVMIFIGIGIVNVNLVRMLRPHLQKARYVVANAINLTKT